MRVPMDSDKPATHPYIHPPAIASVFIVLAYLIARFVPFPFPMPPVLRGMGLVMTFAGFLLGIGALIEFGKAHTSLDPHGSTKQLVTSGVYRFTRNPIYLGFLLMVIGIPLSGGLYWGFVVAPLYVLAMNRLVIEHEERYLQGKFHDSYTSYESRVRRWL